MVDNSNNHQDKELIDSIFQFLDHNTLPEGRNRREKSLIVTSPLAKDDVGTHGSFDFASHTGNNRYGGENPQPNYTESYHYDVYNQQSQGNHAPYLNDPPAKYHSSAFDESNAPPKPYGSPHPSDYPFSRPVGQSPAHNAQAGKFDPYGPQRDELYAMQQQQRFDKLKQVQQIKKAHSGGSASPTGVSSNMSNLGNPNGMNPLAPAYVFKSPATHYLPIKTGSPQSSHSNSPIPHEFRSGSPLGMSKFGSTQPKQPKSINTYGPGNMDQMIKPPSLTQVALAAVTPDLPLKVLSIDVNGSFNSMETAQERAIVFDFIEYCGAQVILMNNTGLMDENQLKIVRNEIKMKFNTESAMWASFGSVEEGGGRGVGVLVLGPLAPRTGWIRSDEKGRYLSASSRIKPGLPVVSFVACDFPNNSKFVAPSTPDSISPWHQTLIDFRDLISSESEKGNLIFVGGCITSVNLGGSEHPSSPEKVVSTSVETIEYVCQSILSSGVYLNSLQNIPDAPSIAPETIPQPRQQPDDILITGLPAFELNRTPLIMKAIRAHRFINQLHRGRDPCIIALTIQGWPVEAYTLVGQNRGSPGSAGSGNRPKNQKKMKNLEGRTGSPLHPYQGSPTTHPQVQYVKDNSTIRRGTPPRGSPVNNLPPSADPMRDMMNKSRESIEDLVAWRNKTADGIKIISMISQKKYDELSLKYDQIKLLLKSIFSCVEGFNNRFNQPGFADTSSFLTLHKLDISPPEEFMMSAETTILHTLTQWNIIADHMIKQLSYSQGSTY